MESKYKILLFSVLLFGLISAHPQRIQWNDLFAPTPVPLMAQQMDFGGFQIDPNEFPFTNNNDDSDLIGSSTQTRPTTAATPTQATTASPQYLACMQSCASTMEYNPVCGSDAITYHNNGRLACARNCGKDVLLLRGGTCRPL